MAARVVALLAAVAMVVGAVFVRDRLDDDTERRTTTLRLVCSTELSAVCEALADDPETEVVATVEPAATTADRLVALPSGGSTALDGWMVAGPWPAMVTEARDRKGLGQALLTTGRVLARSPVVLAVWPDRASALATRCPGGVPGWKCLGEVAGAPWEEVGGQPTWGKVKPGHPPLATGAGLAVLGAATAAYFGQPNLSSAELDDDAYEDWLTRFERAAPPVPGSTLEAMVVRGRSTFDAVGTIEAEAGPLLARSPRQDKPTLLYPSPVATADVVLATGGGPAGRLLTELVSGEQGRRELAGNGWRVAGEVRSRGVAATPVLPRGNGLPSPGLLAALRTTAERLRQ